MTHLYVTRPRGTLQVISREGDVACLHGLTVYEPDDGPRKTGLTDSLGNEIVRLERREPIGFVCGAFCERPR